MPATDPLTAPVDAAVRARLAQTAATRLVAGSPDWTETGTVTVPKRCVGWWARTGS